MEKDCGWGHVLSISWDPASFPRRLSERACRLLAMWSGGLWSYDGHWNEKVTLRLNFAFKLSVLQLFHVGHVVQNSRSTLSLAWDECFSWIDKEWELALFRALSSVSNMKISSCRLADYVKTLHQKTCRTRSTIIFPHSTNQIIDLWCCRCLCLRQILNLLFSFAGQLSFDSSSCYSSVAEGRVQLTSGSFL